MMTPVNPRRPARRRPIATVVQDKDLVVQRRDEIFRAASRVFVSRGYHAATVREIAREAGLSLGGLYAYIRTKEDILYLVFDKLTTTLRDEMRRAIEGIDDPVERIRAALRVDLKTTEAYQDEILLTYRETKSLDRASRRAVLGVSGPQVIEGWHGIPFDRPVRRMREIVDIVSRVADGERLSYKGVVYELPLASGEGKALRLAARPQPGIPIYLATLTPKSLELTGEIADGWLGTSFMPEHASIFVDPIAAGAGRAGRTLAPLDLQAGGVVAFGDDLERLIGPRKPGLAFTLGAMGSRRHNFYNDTYQRAGYADVARPPIRAVSVVLVVIGPRWLGARSAAGRRSSGVLPTWVVGRGLALLVRPPMRRRGTGTVTAKS